MLDATQEKHSTHHNQAFSFFLAWLHIYNCQGHATNTGQILRAAKKQEFHPSYQKMTFPMLQAFHISSSFPLSNSVSSPSYFLPTISSLLILQSNHPPLPPLPLSSPSSPSFSSSSYFSSSSFYPAVLILHFPTEVSKRDAAAFGKITDENKTYCSPLANHRPRQNNRGACDSKGSRGSDESKRKKKDLRSLADWMSKESDLKIKQGLC